MRISEAESGAYLEQRESENFLDNPPEGGGGGGEVLPIMAYTGRLRPKRVPFSGFRYIKGWGFHKLRYVKG